jgi:hypothetical protein
MRDIQNSLKVPERVKRPKHLRAALERGIRAGLFRASIEDGTIRYIVLNPAPR